MERNKEYINWWKYRGKYVKRIIRFGFRIIFGDDNRGRIGEIKRISFREEWIYKFEYYEWEL
jgi:hypothetical protein